MKSLLSRSVLAGLVATAVMTMVTMVAPLMGFPPMNPAKMLAGMMGAPVLVGWAAHFMIGVVFSLGYSYLVAPRIKISSSVLRGILYGFGVFVFAQIAMAMMSAMLGPMPAPEGSMVLMILGSVIGHEVYGIVVALLAKVAPVSR